MGLQFAEASSSQKQCPTGIQPWLAPLACPKCSLVAYAFSLLCLHCSRDRPLSVRRNLARVDEERIDYELLEVLLRHIDETTEPGAVLVFLPGG